MRTPVMFLGKSWFGKAGRARQLLTDDAFKRMVMDDPKSRLRGWLLLVYAAHDKTFEAGADVGNVMNRTHEKPQFDHHESSPAPKISGRLRMEENSGKPMNFSRTIYGQRWRRPVIR